MSLAFFVGMRNKVSKMMTELVKGRTSTLSIAKLNFLNYEREGNETFKIFIVTRRWALIHFIQCFTLF